MQKKNKVMIAAAMGMLAIVVASTAVRCSVARTAAEDAEREQAREAPAEQPSEPGGSEAPSGEEGREGAAGLEADILAALRGNVWQAPGDPQKTVAFRAGSFVEADGSSAALAAFDVVGAGEADGQRYLDVEIVRDGSPAALATTIILEGSDGALQVASDGFAVEKRYVQGKTAGEPVAVTGALGPYEGLIAGKAEGLASAISAWCAAHAPSATRADFDGEVYLDVGAGRVSATFHLDDAARTIVTAVYEGGAFSVQG